MCRDAGWRITEVLELEVDEFLFWFGKFQELLEKEARMIDETSLKEKAL
jgi:hypothetical protein